MFSFIQAFDNSILTFIQNNFQSPVLDKIMMTCTFWGNGATSIWLITALLLLLSKKYRHIGFVCLCALGLNYILGEVVIKNIVQRARPSQFIQAADLLIKNPRSYSFPSGHAASSFAGAMVLAHYFKRYSYCIFLLAGLIAFSRIYLLVHYPTDVIGGIVLGVTSARITMYLLNKNGFKLLL